MAIVFHEETRQFHLYNEQISNVLTVLPNGEIGSLYYGKRIHDRDDFSYLLELSFRPLVMGMSTNEMFSLENTRQEYPSFGTTDPRTPAYEITFSNGSRICHFEYETHNIYAGKKPLNGLPATYVEEDSQADSLEIFLTDPLTNLKLVLNYTIYADYPVITRSVKFVNDGNEKVVLDRALSLNLDLPDTNYEWMQFSGAWARERIPVTKKLDCGITSIESKRGHSSANHNPFVIIKRPATTEHAGEAIGFSFVYSGNFIALAEGDTYGALRFMMGINPTGFSWELSCGEEFQTPEVVMVYSHKGLNNLSQTYHKLFRKFLSRGEWKEKDRPILLNNWEATGMTFDEESILKIASKGKEAGVELFVLDDGWFGARDDDHAGLGDWYVNTKKLPNGIKGLAEKINAMGLKFGLWFEPEMVNADSDLYRAHPDWVLSVPGRDKSLGRHQMVLDFSKPEVVDNIYHQMYDILSDANIEYVKWDMNRSISECFSQNMPANEQGKVYHKYILGVYSLYERLTSDFPHILFESCASGGARFDAGLLYYAPQTWCSDDTDGFERMRIQYGTSYGYPISSIGAHVSETPNQQTGRSVSLETRANVACFGTFGYELDLNHMSVEEFELVKEQIVFMKEKRHLIQNGSFYRISSPDESNYVSWMVVSEDKSEALIFYSKIMARANDGAKRLYLHGLEENTKYKIEGREFYGDELMNAGIIISDNVEECPKVRGDFVSHLIYVTK